MQRFLVKLVYALMLPMYIATMFGELSQDLSRESHLKCLVILGNCINFVYIQHKIRSVDTYIIISNTILRLTTVLTSNHVTRHNQVCAGMSEQFYITRIGYGICHWYPEYFCDRSMDYFIAKYMHHA